MDLPIDKSNELKVKGSKLLPSLAQTFSKSPSSFVEGVYPTYAEKANDCYIYDVDNNKYTDYLMGLGPVVLGYNYDSVNNAIIEQLKKGITFSLPHSLEIDVAEALKRNIPCAEMTRFAKTGSDAVTGAVRAARAITKKNIILYCGGGGVWDDWFSILTNRNKGIPTFNKELIHTFNYNNISQLENLFNKFKNKVAAVIMEPTIFDEPKNDFLNKVKKITHENHSLLIFDEILTGFRISKGGAQEYYNVIPDIATFAKGMANGMPLAAIVGKSEYMKIFEEVFVSTTYGGEALSLAASLVTINEFERKDVCGHLWKLSSKFKKGFNKIVEENNLNAECIGSYPRLKIIIKNELGEDSLLYKSLFLQELIKNGIFMHPNVVLFSFSHKSEDIDNTLTVIEKSIRNLKKAIDSDEVESKLEGKIAKQVISMLPG
jgi:glutamate-1-semialdehyde 2,1-aminomutase